MNSRKTSPLASPTLKTISVSPPAIAACHAESVICAPHPILPASGAAAGGVSRFLEGFNGAALLRKPLRNIEDLSGSHGARRSFAMCETRDTRDTRDTHVMLNLDNRHYGLVHCGPDAFLVSLPSPGDPMLSDSVRLTATPASAPDSDNPYAASAGVESPEDGIFAVMDTLREWGLSRALRVLESLPPCSYDPELSPAGAAAWALVTMCAQPAGDSEDIRTTNSKLEQLALKAPRYPDFSIVLAALVLRNAKGLTVETSTPRQRLNHARELCYQAFRQGPPLYTQTVHLLIETTYVIQGLGKSFGASKTEQQSASDLVWLTQGLSFRTNPYHPFTVLKMR
jgi:hypothetical protein